MLGKLLSTLKSQKSSKDVPIHMGKQQKNENKEKKGSFNQYKLNISILDQQKCKVKGAVSKIRYFVLPELPNMFNQVLGCPISVFHILPHSQRRVKEIDLTKHQYPYYLQSIRSMLQKQIPTFNHLLINDYPAGIGIMAHSDGPAYLPKVVVLSLNSYAIISFQKSYSSGESQSQYKSRILLQPNSVHIFQEDAYTQYLHGIQNYLIDSIFIKYDSNTKQVMNTTISNYDQLHCKTFIEQQIQKELPQIQYGEIRISAISDNPQWTHLVEFTRKQRVSITIRQKYKQ